VILAGVRVGRGRVGRNRDSDGQTRGSCCRRSRGRAAPTGVPDQTQATTAIHDYFGAFYNPRRGSGKPAASGSSGAAERQPC